MIAKKTDNSDVVSFHSIDVLQILERMDVDPHTGLSTTEAALRYTQYGPNALHAVKRRSAWSTLKDQLNSLLTLLLIAATVISIVVGDHAEAAAIIAVIVFNTAIGFGAERRAITSMEALRRLGVTTTPVRRDGTMIAVLAEHLVPGDIVRLEAGDVVTADLRLITASHLESDESLLTGESLPVSKVSTPVDESAPVADRLNMMFKGTSITRGSGEAVVVATGISTQLGEISDLVEKAQDEITPLEKRLNKMSRQLMWAALAISVVVLAIGILSGRDPVLMAKVGIALAIAAIPEGLPVVATLALARGMWRLARRNALVRRLSAVETLGSVTVIFTDKTGTLTENRMTATDLVLPGVALSFDANTVDLSTLDTAMVQRAARVLALCSSAEVLDRKEGTGIGDPMELALLRAAATLNFDTDHLEEIREVAFDPDTRMMATLHSDNGGILALVKGAPEAVIARASSIVTGSGTSMFTDADRSQWEARVREHAAEGLRVLALADRQMTSVDDPPYEDLTFLGLVLLQDPPRADARPAIEAAQRAGIKVVMITGDNAGTAAKVAKLVGLADIDSAAVVEGKALGEFSELSADQKKRLLETPVFARVSPKQKLDLISLYQQSGEIVAMTGDGVNDAPALKKADIGVAMGLRGTPVAKEAADVVLKDDAFASIVAAIRQGRVVFANIRKFVIYLLSCNLSEVLVVAIGTASGLPLPLMPLQILFLNLVTDVFPALALGFGEGDEDALERPPRNPQEHIVIARHWYAIGLYGVTLTIAVLAAYVWALQDPNRGSQYPGTVAFLTLAFAQMWHVFNMRSRMTSAFRNQVLRNPYVWAALALCGALTLGAVYSPSIATLLSLVEPDAITWGIILTASLMPLVAGQLFMAIPMGKLSART